MPENSISFEKSVALKRRQHWQNVYETAWVRTTQATPDYRGIVCKYEPGSGNGYSMHLFNGRLCAWYFRDGANKIYAGDPGIDGGFIADLPHRDVQRAARAAISSR